MRTILFVTVTVLLGAILGGGAAVWRFKAVPWNRALDESEETTSVATAKRQAAPKAVVDSAQHDFGTVEDGTKQQHDFVFTNGGDAPLTLAEGHTSGGGIVVECQQSELAPGASAKVSVTWTPTGRARKVKSSIEILTNDPAQPYVPLTVSGVIKEVLRFSKPSLTFKGLLQSEGGTAETQLFCYDPQPLKILDHRWLNAATAKYFDVAIQPLSEEQLQEDPRALGGFLVKVTVKPGLKLGRLYQTLVLTTDVAASPSISLAIQGDVLSDIAVVGRGWRGGDGILGLGHVDRAEGLTRTVQLLVRGPLRHDVRFDIAKSVPQFMKVSLGEARDVNDGTAVQIPLTIEIPPGSPVGTYLGPGQGRGGEIILNTAHPQVPPFTLRVEFVIEG